jgi:hypothetical protein
MILVVEMWLQSEGNLQLDLEQQVESEVTKVIQRVLIKELDTSKLHQWQRTVLNPYQFVDKTFVCELGK